MAKRLQYRRLLALVLLLGVAFVALGFRLVDLQVLRHEELSIEAAQQSQKRIVREPRRGDILDARGNPLATSVFVKTVYADPVLMGNCQAKVARTVAPLLGLNEAEVFNKLLPRTRTNELGRMITNRYVRLKRKVPFETWEKIRLAMGKLDITTNDVSLPPKQFNAFCRELQSKAISAELVNDQLRVYPNARLAAHVLGYVGESEGVIENEPIIETRGKDGIESTLDAKLAGVRGWRETETDSRKRELVALRGQNVEPRDGLNVVLTIDSVIQHILETALAEGQQKHSPISISGIVVRPRTGEILALATLPDFDPNSPGADAEARRNRAITDLVEPGSTFKIVVVSGALNESVVKPTDQFDCENGRFPFGGRVLHDHDPYGYFRWKA